MSYDRKKNKILAAVVTYNRKALLKECIESLLKQSYKYFDILVVDNASTDGTEEELKPMVEAGTILYHNNGENLGGAGGFNKAMRIAVEKGYEYVWVMDDDTIPTEEALLEIIKAARRVKKKWGFISSNVKWIDGSKCRMNEQKFYLRSGYCRQATFVSMMIPTRIIKALGLPIKEFYIWGDDVEYSRRISKYYPCYYADNSIVIHKTVNNEGSNIAKDSVDRLERYRFAYRNEVYIAKKESGIRIIYQIMKVLWHIYRVIALSNRYRLKRIWIIFTASFMGLRFDPDIEYV